MSTADWMTPQQQQDLRDAGRGHLIDGGRAAALIDKADELRKQAREDAATGVDLKAAHDGLGSVQKGIEP